jgi:hypothetical protein
MPRLLCVVMLLCWSSAAFGQVIFAPPDQARPVVHTPPGVQELQNALRQPRFIFMTPPTPAETLAQPFIAPGSSVLIVPSGPVVSPDAAGVDPQTAQPLYFRKRDLIAPPAPLFNQPAQTQPLIVPELRIPTTQPAVEPGQIIIKPYRGAAKSFVSR